jgi:hypothetical protein
MKPIEFEEAYPEKLGAGDCPNTGDLPYVIAEDPDTKGPVFLLSCWELTPEELAAVRTTGKVWLGVMARRDAPTQPPVFLSGFHPFVNGYIKLDRDELTWERITREYTFILGAIADGEMSAPEGDLQLKAWHHAAEAWVTINPHYKGRLEDFLKHS